jgi:hypothetical protein
MRRESAVIEEVTIMGQEHPLLPPGVGEDVLVRTARQPDVGAKHGIPTESLQQTRDLYPEAFVDEEASLLAECVELRVLGLRCRR